MASPGKTRFIFPNLAIDPTATPSSPSETNGVATNIQTERVDSWWSPADFNSARYIDIDWSSSVKFNCVIIPHAYMSGVTLSGVTWQIDSPKTSPTETKSGNFYISNSGAGATARNELAQPNKGLESGDDALYVSGNRWSSYLVFDNMVTTTSLRITFTPSSPSAAVLRVPCVIVGYYFGLDRGIDWSGSFEPAIHKASGHIRRVFRWSAKDEHGYDLFSRWWRQRTFRGAHQKWAMIYSPSWSQLHYETFIWGYMHDLNVKMTRFIDDDVYRYTVSGRIVESLNGELKPG